MLLTLTAQKKQQLTFTFGTSRENTDVLVKIFTGTYSDIVTWFQCNLIVSKPSLGHACVFTEYRILMNLLVKYRTLPCYGKGYYIECAERVKRCCAINKVKTWLIYTLYGASGQ